MTNRARLTLVDIIYIGTSIAVLGILGQPFYRVLADQGPNLGTGMGLLMQSLVPGILIALLVVVFTVATEGRVN